MSFSTVEWSVQPMSMYEACLTQSWHTGQNMNVPIHNCDRNPEVTAWKDELLLGLEEIIRRQLDHPELSGQCW